MKRLIFSFLLLSLTGCQTITGERIACPKSSIVAEVSKSIDLKDGIPVRTEIDKLSPSCTVSRNNIWMDVKLRFTSLRPIQSSQFPLVVTPTYFVAVVDEGGNVLSKSHHQLDVTFEGQQATKVNIEHLEQKIPPNKNVKLYVGFVLDEMQIEYFQKERDVNGN